MSKKELSSDEMGTVKRSRTPTVVLTANGEVRTHGEAQVFVHDSNQFVVVQLLEETPAVLSVGKLLQSCQDHGYSYEWVSGQEARLTRKGKIFSARQTILNLLTFQDYLWILEAVRLQQRHHKNRWDQRHP